MTIIDIALEIPNCKETNLTLIQFTPLHILIDANQFILNESFQNVLSNETKMSHVTHCIDIHEIYYCTSSNQPGNHCIVNLVLRTILIVKMYPLKFSPKCYQSQLQSDSEYEK